MALENQRLKQIEARNAEAWKQIEAYREEARQKTISHKELLLRIRDAPYFGLVPCRAGNLDFVMFHAHDDVVAREYLWRGEDGYEPQTVRTWVEWCRTPGVVLDIGGYSGLMSILAARANPGNDVHLFEPIDRTIERANVNVKVNGLGQRITLHHFAASDVEGEATIHLYRDENFLGTGNSIDIKENVPVIDKKTIRTVALDQYMPDLRPSVVKIDVEGHELATLNGMISMLRQSRPNMIIEVWSKTRAEVLGLLADLGYEYQRVEKVPRNVENYIATPRRSG